jgi:hypothetical protein
MNGAKVVYHPVRHYYKEYDTRGWVEVFVEDKAYCPQGIRFIYFGPLDNAIKLYDDVRPLPDHVHRAYERWLLLNG